MSAPHSNDVPKNRLPVTFADVDHANSPGSIAQRDSEGGVRVRYPTQSVHSATKGYVDEKVGTRSPTSHSHPVGDITTSGTASSSTYLRGDGTWATPTNTTYAVMTQAEAEAGTAATARTTSAVRLRDTVRHWVTGSATTAISAIGQALNKAATAAEARSAIGAGTSDLALGTTSTTAKAGNWTPTWGEVQSKPATFPPDTHTHTPASIGAEPAQWYGTQAQYDAISTKDPNRTYNILEG